MSPVVLVRWTCRKQHESARLSKSHTGTYMMAGTVCECDDPRLRHRTFGTSS